MSDILNRIGSQIKIPGILAILEKLPLTDWQSLMLEVSQLKAEKLTPKCLMHQKHKGRFVKASPVDQRRMVAFDSLAYETLPRRFEAFELSPIAPFGINHLLGGTNQKNVLSTVRNTEVVADPTTELALIAAHKRQTLLRHQHKSSERIAVATSHRIVRGQCFGDIPGFVPHFRLFAIATAGRDTGHTSFEQEVLTEHVTFYLSLIEKLIASGEYAAKNLTVAFSDTRIIETLAQVFHMDRSYVGRHTQDASYSVFSDHAVPLPKKVQSTSELSEEVFARFGIHESLRLLQMFEIGVVTPLRNQYPQVNFVFDIERIAGMGYYSTLCVKITAENRFGKRFPLVDGGMSTWTQALINSKKERFFSSAIGSELFCSQFGAN